MFTLALGDENSGFEREFRYLADKQGLATSAGRHPSADLLPIFNDSYQRLINLVTSYGYTQHLERGTTTALPTSPVETNETYAVVTTAEGEDQVKAVDVRFGGSDWFRLPEISFSELRDYTPRQIGVTPSGPLGWCWLTSGTVSEDTFTGGSIAFAPVPQSGDYCLWTMKTKTRLDETDDVFLYHTADWKQWHMYDAMAQVAGVRDKNSEKRLIEIQRRLNPNIEGTPAYNIRAHAPTIAGPKTWRRGRNYRGRWGR